MGRVRIRQDLHVITWFKCHNKRGIPVKRWTPHGEGYVYDCHEPYDLLSRVVVHAYRVMGAALRILRTSEEAKASRNKARNESTSRSELFHLPKLHQTKVYYLCV